MIIIIGGSGFVGTRLCSTLDNYKILDLKAPKNGKHYEYCDVTKPETLSGKISKDAYVILLAAEHRDDVSPVSKYYDTNVQGMRNVLREMDKVGCKGLLFTSSVAVYGLNKLNPNEKHNVDPFNHYGKSKWEAEKVLIEWYRDNPTTKSITVVRPTVIFGEKNRGNVYNLLRQIATGRFLMIGDGQNKKSMAYIGNVVSFIKYRWETSDEGYEVFNYVDKPDLNMSSLLKLVERILNKKTPSMNIPTWLGYLGGYSFDVLSLMTKQKFMISSVRVKKFIATTQFDAIKVHSSGFHAPFSLEEGLNRTLNYEFVEDRFEEDEVFFTE